MRFRYVALVVVLAVVVGVGVLFWRGAGPIPDPEGCTAVVGEQHVYLSTEQAELATLIAAVGVHRGLPARAVSIALATAYQESKIRNLSSGDRDSVGIFQQRPSQGWGRPAQLQDPIYASNKFYDALAQVPDYQTMRITEAAQKVQRSGYPEAYEPHAPDARALASALTGYSPGGTFSCVVHASSARGSADEVISRVDRAFAGLVSLERSGSRQDLLARLPAGQTGQRAGWAVAAYLVGHAARLHIQTVSFAGRTWHAGRPSEKGWTGPGGATTTLRVGMG